MSDRRKPKKKNNEKAPQTSLKLTIPPLHRVMITPPEKDSSGSQPETGTGITTSVVSESVPLAESADTPVVSTPPPTSMAMDNALQEPEDDTEITPYRPSTPLCHDM
jgi:hypothetical protein